MHDHSKMSKDLSFWKNFLSHRKYSFFCFHFSFASVLLNITRENTPSQAQIKLREDSGFHQSRSRSRSRRRKKANDLMKIENRGHVSGVISSTESRSEESERFHFFRLRLRPDVYDPVKRKPRAPPNTFLPCTWRHHFLKSKIKKWNEDMILALAGQFKQLSHEPEKFRWLNGIRTHWKNHFFHTTFLSRNPLLSYDIPFTGKHEPNKLTCSQLCDLIAQLVRALHRHRRGHGFESRWVTWIFQVHETIA